jgi:steroid delta-isomerase-like uncharacterized protein
VSTPSTIHREFSEAWNARDFDKIRSLYHSEYSYTGGDGHEVTGGPDIGIQVAKMWTVAFPDGRLEVRKTYTQGSTAISEMVGRGKQTGPLSGIAPTGRSVEVVICNVLELRDGKVYREREYLDMASIFEQLGVTSIPRRAATA